ncbi:hypothetical protein M436DRAFT_78233 [Aureobasidium namibiae CBS 147.97]|uniref:Uncharacterized protein n=1 Tax=Aureobasidium namibiae CBS 147.97 TaxID=1043004 RepID=A0A074WTE4_9PEZI
MDGSRTSKDRPRRKIARVDYREGGNQAALGGDEEYAEDEAPSNPARYPTSKQLDSVKDAAKLADLQTQFDNVKSRFDVSLDPALVYVPQNQWRPI